MGNDYDKIIKENLRDIVGTLIKKVIGIKTEKLIQVDPNLPKTSERKADFVFKINPDKYNKQSRI